MNPLAYVRSTVVKGFGRGSKELGCPTANIDNINHLTLSTGIYCGLVQLVIRNESEIQEDPECPSAHRELQQKLPFVSGVKGMVCSFGYNPQYNNKEKSFEVHILDDFDFNFYGSELRVLVCEKLRDEKKYNSIEELKKDISNDIKNAKNAMVRFQHHINNTDYFQKQSLSDN